MQPQPLLGQYLVGSEYQRFRAGAGVGDAQVIEKCSGDWHQLTTVVYRFHQVEHHISLFGLQPALRCIQVQVDRQQACLVSLCMQSLGYVSDLIQDIAGIRR